MYVKIPLGLMNEGKTFQWAMDIAFVDEKDKILVIYLDDIIVFQISMRNTSDTCSYCSENAESLASL